MSQTELAFIKSASLLNTASLLPFQAFAIVAVHTRAASVAQPQVIHELIGSAVIDIYSTSMPGRQAPVWHVKDECCHTAFSWKMQPLVKDQQDKPCNLHQAMHSILLRLAHYKFDEFLHHRCTSVVDKEEMIHEGLHCKSHPLVSSHHTLKHLFRSPYPFPYGCGQRAVAAVVVPAQAHSGRR